MKDVDSLDAGWDDEEDEDEEDDLDALDAGWENPNRRRTPAEIAVARKQKALAKAERRASRAASIAQKQKKKKPRATQPPVPNAKGASRVARSSSAPAVRSSPDTRLIRPAAARDWKKMIIAVAIIVAVASAAAFFFSRR